MMTMAPHGFGGHPAMNTHPAMAGHPAMVSHAAMATRVPAMATSQTLHPALGGGGAPAAMQSPSGAPHPGPRPYDYYEEEEEKEYTDIFPQPKGTLGGNAYLAPHLHPMGAPALVHSTGHTRGLTGVSAAHMGVHEESGVAPTGHGCLSLFPFCRRAPPPQAAVQAAPPVDLLQQQFDDARSQAVRRVSTRTPEHLRVGLHVYYKQAMEGDAPAGGRPGWIHQEDRKFYDAWAKQKGLGAQDAMRKYIDTVNLL